jgi:hypothetical protein
LESGFRDFRPEQTQSHAAAPLSLADVDWSQQQRDFFLKHCGEIMAAYGYSLDARYYLSGRQESSASGLSGM